MDAEAIVVAALRAEQAARDVLDSARSIAADKLRDLADLIDPEPDRR